MQGKTRYSSNVMMQSLNFPTKSHCLVCQILVVGVVVFLCGCQATETAQDIFNRAEKLRDSGLVADAQTVYQEAIKKDPKFAPPYRSLAEMATIAEDMQSALLYWNEYLQREPKAKHGWCQLAHREMAVGLEVPARDHAEKELELDPECSRANLLLGVLYTKVGNAKRALTHLEKAAKANPNEPRIQLTYGKVLALADQYDTAESVLKPLLEKEKSQAEVFHWLGYTYARRAATPQDKTEAEKLLKRAIELQPLYAPASFELGRLLVQQRRFPEAIPYLERALAGDKFEPGIPFALQQAYAATGKTAEATKVQAEFKKRSDWDTRRKSLLRTYATDPKSTQTLLALGKLEVERGDFQTAAIFLQSAVSLEPENAELRAEVDNLVKLLPQTPQPTSPP